MSQAQAITMTSAPCSWGAGFGRGEIGPYGSVPLDVPRLSQVLHARGLTIATGSFFDDLAGPANRNEGIRQTDEIRALDTEPPKPATPGRQPMTAPYLAGVDRGLFERDFAAEIAPEPHGFCRDSGHQTYARITGDHIRFFVACVQGALRPIGRGSNDDHALRRWRCDRGNGGNITLEQERNPRDQETVLADLAASRRFLATMGF